MLALAPTILALAFDGVICDSFFEYFQITCQIYMQLWPAHSQKLIEYAPSFSRLRSVIDADWELLILLRALVTGVPEEKIAANWSSITQSLTTSEQLDKLEISKELNEVRRNWIESDFEAWLDSHRFYPGVLERLQHIVNSPIQLFVVTTQEKYFVDQLLQRQGIYLPKTAIIGRESHRPKHQILREIVETFSEVNVNAWYIEHKTRILRDLEEQPELAGLQLFLATWGANREPVRQVLLESPRISTLSLPQFYEDFSTWQEFIQLH